MAIPSFSYMGGKARLRKWLVEHFPKSGGVYMEPFVGTGNVFFAARRSGMKFSKWILSDINPFLLAVRDVRLRDIPDSVTREDFEGWRTRDDVVAKVIEPRISFAGKGYQAGFSGTHPSHPPFNGELYRDTLIEAKILLMGVDIWEQPWDAWRYDRLSPADFVYFDPPYYGTNASYPNIDHEDLVRTLNNAGYRWALSGYDNELYQKELAYVRKVQKERNSEIKSSNTGRREAVIETLWMNY